MPTTEKEILEAIRAVDKRFENKGFVRWNRLISIYPRFVYTGLAILLFYVGFRYLPIATQAALANQLDLSIAIQALAIAILALIIAIVPQINSADMNRAEQQRFRGYVFNKMKASVANPILLRVILRMKTWLPHEISLEQVYNANETLFTEEELARRLLDRS